MERLTSQIYPIGERSNVCMGKVRMEEEGMGQREGGTGKKAESREEIERANVMFACNSALLRYNTPFLPICF